MKNKFRYISFFILFICIMFGFKVDVGARTCNYSYEPYGDKVLSLEEIDLIKAFMLRPNVSVENEGITNIYNIYKMYIFIDNNDEYLLEAMAYGAQSGLLGGIFLKKEIISLGNGILTSNVDLEKCPPVIGVSFYKDDSGNLPVFGHKADVYFSENYDNIDLIAKKVRDANQMVFILNDIVNGSDAISCVNDDDVNTLKQLLNKIPNIEYFSDYKENTENMYGFEKLFSETSYFSGKCDSIKEQIEFDKNKFETIMSGDMINCMKNNGFVSSSASGVDTLESYFTVFGSNDERYLAKYLDVLPTAYSILLSSDNLESICVANEENNLIESAEKYCAGADSNSYHKCVQMRLGIITDNVNCEKLYEKRNDIANLNSVEKYIVKKSDESCTNKQCFIKTCISMKNEINKSSKELSNGTTNAQKEAKKTLAELKNDWFEHEKIEFNNSFCNNLFGEGSKIMPYIEGGLNIIQIAGPILTLILTMLDGIKTFTSMKDDEQKKFFDKLKIRLICIALLFLIPTIIKFLLKLVIKVC